LLIVN